jgi:hypothetical protein
MGTTTASARRHPSLSPSHRYGATTADLRPATSSLKRFSESLQSSGGGKDVANPGRSGPKHFFFKFEKNNVDTFSAVRLKTEFYLGI